MVEGLLVVKEADASESELFGTDRRSRRRRHVPLGCYRISGVLV